MFYTFSSVKVFVGSDYDNPQADCTIVMDNGAVRVLTIDLSEHRVEAIESILRREIDAQLNEEAAGKTDS